MRIASESLGSVTDLISGERCTQDDLRAAADRTAALVGSVRGSAVDHVIIAHGGTADFFGDLFGVWQAGACAVCIAPDLTANELGVICDFVSPAAILMGRSGGPDLSGVTTPVFQSAVDRPVGQGDATSPVTNALDRPAVMLFTSGTTGQPKGVVHSFRSLLSRVALNRAFIGTDTLRRSLCVLPTHFGHGLIGNCLTPLLGGDDLYLYPDTSLRGIQGIGAAVAQNDISFMSSVPAFWRMALRVLPPLEKETLKRVHIGSSPLSADLWQGVIDWCGTDEVANLYGITETANWAAGAIASQYAPEDGLIGRMLGGTAAVLDESGDIRGHGQGEIMLQTPSLMSGYHGRPDLSAEVLRDGWYLTGDIGEIAADGTMRLTGRQKAMINKAGMKVHPEEVDLLLEQNPHVAEACCFAVPDPVQGETVGAAVVFADADSEISAKDLRGWCQSRIKPQAVPDKWFFVSSIPKTDRGKINRDAVRDHCMKDGG